MGKRTYMSDITAMALLFRKEYCGTSMILYDKVKEFDRIINEYLENKNSSCGIGVRCISEDTSSMYFMATDEEDKLYAVINPTADLKKAWDWHVNLLPSDVLSVAYEENALNAIGLQTKDGKICQMDIKKESKPFTRTLTK